MPSFESLHTHTTLSDGKLSHREMFELAESLGVAVIAFTDHDSIPPESILDELESLRERKTKWIIGTELTTDLPKELAPNSTVVHLIGLFVDPRNESLLKHCQRAQEARVRRMQGIVTNLNVLGFRITADDCLEMSGGESVGRPHIVRALAKYPENNLVTERIRLEMAREAEHDADVRKRYTQMMEKGERAYSYTLFLSPDAFRAGYAEYDYMPDLDEAVGIIRNAGGVAILAHYGTIRSKMSLDFTEKLLAEKRIDGVEVIYGIREYGTNEEETLSKERSSLRQLAQKYGALALGGSDAHTREDLEYYVANDWFSNESIGMTERLLATDRVNKQFSSLE